MTVNDANKTASVAVSESVDALIVRGLAIKREQLSSFIDTIPDDKRVVVSAILKAPPWLSHEWFDDRGKQKLCVAEALSCGIVSLAVVLDVALYLGGFSIWLAFNLVPMLAIAGFIAFRRLKNGTNLFWKKPLPLRQRDVAALKTSELLALIWVIGSFVAGVVVCCASVFSSLVELVPDGDEWWTAFMRLIFVATAFMIGWRVVPKLFRRSRAWSVGRFSPAFVRCLYENEVPQPPSTWHEELRANWQLLAATVLSCLLITGVINVDSSVFDFDDAQKLRMLFRLTQWVRGNPNTVTLAAIVIGATSFGRYVYHPLVAIKYGNAFCVAIGASLCAMGVLSVFAIIE